MKKILTILFIVLAASALGQSRKMMEVMSNARMLENQVFGSKDSARLVVLLGKTVTYTDYNGIVRSREEAIDNIVHSKVTYTIMNLPMPYDVSELNESMVVKHICNMKEKKEGSAETILKLSVESVWLKENGKWKLSECKIIKQ